MWDSLPLRFHMEASVVCELLFLTEDFKLNYIYTALSAI